MSGVQRVFEIHLSIHRAFPLRIFLVRGYLRFKPFALCAAVYLARFFPAAPSVIPYQTNIPPALLGLFPLSQNFLLDSNV